MTKKATRAVSLENMFSDPTFQWSTKHSYPNRIYGNGKKIGALVAVRGRREDFAVNVSGLDYVVKAETEGRLKEGYVVLAKKNGGTAPEYIAAARVSEVAERLRGVTPLEGDYGPYHWITATFQPATRGNDADVPF